MHLVMVRLKKLHGLLRLSLKQCGLMVECLSLGGGAAHFNLDQYDSVLIGSPIRYGHHLPEVFDFIKQHEMFLNQHPVRVFSVLI